MIAQLLGTSLWFSGNAAASDLARLWNLSSSEQAMLLMAVQVGFIIGTLSLSLSGLADRFRASRLFALAAVLGALANAGFALASPSLGPALGFRLLTGLALAGVYPLGMKLVVGWSPGQSGVALGWLVGALTLGTATPFLVRGLGVAWDWQSVVLTSSGLALLAALLVYFLGDGPHLPASTLRKPIAEVLRVFQNREFLGSALGYFGHMWELYAFWALVPNLVHAVGTDGTNPANVAVLSFVVIASGALGCVLGGCIAHHIGSGIVARSALSGSGLCCLLFPIIPNNAALAIAVLGVWGFFVVADSPQFSAVSARSCPTDSVGGALAIQNGIGFAITLASISLTAAVWPHWGQWTVWLLFPGPILGLLAMMILWKRNLT